MDTTTKVSLGHKDVVLDERPAECPWPAASATGDRGNLHLWSCGETELGAPHIPAQTENDSLLLSSLRPHAEAVAADFGREILASFLESQTTFRFARPDLDLLESESQHWFIGLFSPPNFGYRGAHQNEFIFPPDRVHLPLSLLLNQLEIILKFGYKVTALSPQSERSWIAFSKSLSAEFARQRIYAEQHLEFVSELLLLD